MADRFEICPTSEIPPGGRKIIEVKNISIGIFNVEGEFYALHNKCPHQFAPLCRGKITGATQSDKPGEFEWTKDNEVVRCPYHGWEFDILSGESIFNPHKVRTRTFETEVEESSEIKKYGTEIKGDEPPVDTFDVEVEEEIVVVYV